MIVGRVLASLLVLGAATTAGAAAVVSIDGPASVGRTAARDAPFSPDAVCDLSTVRALSIRHPEVRQFVVMATAAWNDDVGTVEVAVRTGDGGWRCQVGARPARFGRNGSRPLRDRRSGDGTTPAGVFPLGSVQAWDGQVFGMFGNRPDPGVLASYRMVRPQDCWGATPGTERYQRLVDRPGCPGPDDEWLPRYGDVYSHAAVIGANLDPVSGDQPGEPAYAAAIFLHRNAVDASGRSRPTSGCVSLGADDLVTTLRRLDPRLDPHFAIGPLDWLRSEA